MAALARAVDTWAELGLAATWQLATLAALVWICERLFRIREPRFRHGMWWFVLLSPLILAPARLALSHRPAVVSVSVPTRVTRVIAPPPVARPSPRPSITSAASRPLPQPPVAPVRANKLVSPVKGALATAWLFGCALSTLRLLAGRSRARRILANSRPMADQATRRALAAVCASAGVTAPVGLRESDVVRAPLLWGWRKPVIVIPSGWSSDLPDDEVRATLAHEVAHVRRRDFVANLLQRALGVPLFFHPGAWLASRRIALAREELCDAWALRLGTDPASYARSLAAAAERAHGGLAPVSLGIAESRSTLLRRVEAVMQSEKRKRLSRPWAVALVVMLVVGAGILVGVQVRAEQGQSASGLSRWSAIRIASVVDAYTAPAAAPAPAERVGTRTLTWPYSASFQHNVRLTFDSYIKGKRSGDYQAGGGVIPAGPGRHIITIKVNDAGDEVRLSADLDGTPAGEWARAVRGQRSISEDMLSPDVQGDKQAPIYVFKLCSNDPGLERTKRIPRYQSSVAEVANATDLAVFVMAELRGEGLAPAPAAGPVGRPGVPPEAAAAAEEPGMIFEAIALKYWPAGYMLYLFGAAGNPDNVIPAPGLLPTPRATNGSSPADHGGGGLGGMAGKQPVGESAAGALRQFLPKGIKLLTAASSLSRSIVVAGTPEAVAQLREFVGMLDRKPDTVRIAAAVYPAAPEEGATIFYASDSQSPGKSPTCQVAYLANGKQWTFKGLPQGFTPAQMELDTQNLVPGVCVVPAGPAARRPQMLLSAVPQVLGDGSVNIVLRLTELGDSDDPKAAIASGSSFLTTVNVRDGETFGIVVTHGSSTETVTITPQIVKE